MVNLQEELTQDQSALPELTGSPSVAGWSRSQTGYGAG